MTAIRYAFRDDPLNVYMLSEGAIESSKHTQIFTFRKREIAVDFLSDFYFLVSRPPRTIGLTHFGKQIENKNWKNPYCYIAKVDCQIEFIIRRSIFEHLQETFHPLWTPDVHMAYYCDQPSGFIVLLRIFRVDEKLDIKLLEKGQQGSSQIIRLYDEFDENAKVEVDRLEPVLPKNRYTYIKDELLYTLKKENSLIAIYENSPQGNGLLQDRIDAMRSTHTKLDRWYDPDSEIDMAQIDYSKVYNEIRRLAPTMASLVNYVSEIKPSQPRETDHLMDAAQQNDPIAQNRILEMNMRSALRYGLWMYNRYHVDIQEAIQEAMIGLFKALKKYDMANNNKFSTYALLWMRQIMNRYLPIGEYVARFPFHKREKLLPLMELLEHHECIECSSGKFCDDIIHKAQEIAGCSSENAPDLLNLLIPPLSIEEMLMKNEEVDDEKHSEDNMIAELDKQLLSNTIKSVLSTLSDREEDIIRKRYGFSRRPMTLEAVGQDYGLTRERIRQIEVKAINNLRKASRSKILKPFW